MVYWVGVIYWPCPAIAEGSFADSSLFFRRSCDYEIHKLEQAGGRGNFSKHFSGPGVETDQKEVFS